MMCGPCSDCRPAPWKAISTEYVEYQTGESEMTYAQCCCGKYRDISEPININRFVHEPLGPDGNFCGSQDKHDIRDLRAALANEKDE